MTRLHDKSKLLQILSETPIVTLACKKVGLNPCTYYRWYKSDQDFKRRADEILSIGRLAINDMAEGSIIKEIKDGNMRANIFWLQHNDPRYRPVRTTYVEPLGHKHELSPGEVCRTCGYQEPEIKETKQYRSDNIAREIYNRLQTGRKRKITEEKIKEIIDDVVNKSKLNEINKIEWVVVDGKKRNDEEKADDL